MPQRKDLMSVRTLLLTSDVQVIEMFSQFAEMISIQVEPQRDAELAISKLCDSKFEGVIVDLLYPGGMEILRKLRTLKSNSSAVSFAILGYSHEQSAAFQAGANFLFERPLVANAALRVLRVSYALMVREKRRYYRCPVQIAATIIQPGGAESTVTSWNISESGICLNIPDPMHPGDKLRMRLRLPGYSHSIDIHGDVCWSTGGRTGLQFCDVKPEVANALRNWLAEQLEENLNQQPPERPGAQEVRQ